VIGNHLTALRPELKVGDRVTLNLDERLSEWTIVGIYRMAGNVTPPVVYANGEYLQRELKQVNEVVSLRVVTNQHDGVSQRRVATLSEELLRKAGIEVSTTLTGAEITAANVQSTDILVYFLLVMALLIAIVGGLGLASTMTLNVMERTREVGVMRAIGASSGSILQMVIVEGLFIGLLSWLLGALLAVPIGKGLAYVVGISFLQSPLQFVFSPDGFLLWLALVVVISTLASVLPARTASRLTIREVLAYE
jgi:putative ABC transport system permease protein